MSEYFDRVRQLVRSAPVSRVFLPLGIALLLLWAFAELADEVVEGSTKAMDEWVLRHMRTAHLNDPVGPPWLEDMARDVTSLGSNVVLALMVAVVTAYLWLRRKLRTALFVIGSVGLGFGAVYVLKLGFDRPRPELVSHGQGVYTSSFPSGHTMGSALTFLTLAALLARIEDRRSVQAFLVAVALSLSALVGISRVYLGVHYPTDILGGWAVGVAWALGAWVVADVLARRGKLDPEVEE